MYETHMHTPLCKHAVGTPHEYAEHAVNEGLKGIIVTCHCPLPDRISEGVRMSPEEWPLYVDLVRETAEAFEETLDVRLGIESDYLPGLEGWLEELHSRAPLNYVLGSVHPQLPEYKERYLRWDWPTFHRQYFQSLVEAAESGLFDCLSHPDLVKNMGSDHWAPENMVDHIEGCLDRIAATGIAMELNTSGVNKTVSEMNPAPFILRAMNERNIPVVIGADAHVPERVADGFHQALDLLESCGYRTIRYFLDREPNDLSIEDAKNSLIGHRTSPTH